VSQRVSGIGVELVAETRGSGPDVALVHGMASDHVAILEAFAPLAGEARLVAFSRRGYGGSEAPEPYQGTTVPEQAEDAAAAFAALGVRDAVGCGEGFGALVVLDLLLRHPGLLHAAVLVDPPLYALAPDATRALADAAAELQAAVAERGPRAGVERWLAPRLDGPARERALDAHGAFFADYAGLATLPVTRAQLRAIAVPVVLVTGPGSGLAEAEAADALAALIPGARRATDGDPVAAARSLL
jgi:pimeloyl-ACP methyl ester carboxylesterase